MPGSFQKVVFSRSNTRSGWYNNKEKSTGGLKGASTELSPQNDDGVNDSQIDSSPIRKQELDEVASQLFSIKPRAIEA
jgi:hypothetical protein